MDVVKVENYPMMSEHEVEILDKLFESRKPEVCLEWGSGGSTIYFPNKHKFIRQWISIEHNGHYVKAIKDNVDQKRTTVLWAHMHHYIDLVKHQARRYDFILVDGKNRAKCLAVAADLVKEDGVVILHDSGRNEYRGMIADFPGKLEKLCDGQQARSDGGYAHRGLTKFWI